MLIRRILLPNGAYCPPYPGSGLRDQGAFEFYDQLYLPLVVR